MSIANKPANDDVRAQHDAQVFHGGERSGDEPSASEAGDFVEINGAEEVTVKRDQWDAL